MAPRRTRQTRASTSTSASTSAPSPVEQSNEQKELMESLLATMQELKPMAQQLEEFKKTIQEQNKTINELRKGGGKAKKTKKTNANSNLGVGGVKNLLKRADKYKTGPYSDALKIPVQRAKLFVKRFGEVDQGYKALTAQKQQVVDRISGIEEPLRALKVQLKELDAQVKEQAQTLLEQNKDLYKQRTDLQEQLNKFGKTKKEDELKPYVEEAGQSLNEVLRAIESGTLEQAQMEEQDQHFDDSLSDPDSEEEVEQTQEDKQ